MAKFFDNFKLKVAQQAQRQKFDLSCQNLTTMDAYKLKCVYARELAPNTTHNVNLEVFTRLSPLANPMLGQMRMVNRAFFVPFRTVWKSWTAFITDTKVQHGSTLIRPNSVPLIANNDLFELLYSNAEIVHGDVAYDFCQGDVKLRLTELGRRFYDILLNLGYSINFTDNDNQNYSALPLLCVLRIVYDWLSNNQYENADVLLKYFELGPRDQLVLDDLDIIMPLISVLYHNDYFTSAFDNPNGPNVSGTSFTLSGESDPYHGVTDVTYNPGNTPNTNRFNGSPYAYASSNGNGGRFTQFTIDALKFMTDHIKRMQYVGTRAIDRYFAKFGTKLDAAKLDRCQYIGKSEVTIQISDVMQTATDSDTGLGLGDYAGKGVAYGKGNFQYTTDEFGMFIILSFIEPRTSTVQGLSRHVLHTSPLDYFTPEFDSLSYQAIDQKELFADYKGRESGWTAFCNQHNYAPNGVFGFQSRYAEYKCENDKLTGDFRLGSLHTSLSPWHLFRMLPNMNEWTGNNTDLSTFKHNYDFRMPAGEVYNRVFADSGLVSNVDHFFTLFNFDVTSYAPMHPLFEAYHFDGHGKDVNVQVGGTNLND